MRHKSGHFEAHRSHGSAEREGPEGSAHDAHESAERSAIRGDAGDWEEEPVVALTPEEAQALRARHPVTSPWRVVAVQTIAGVLCVALVWAVARRDGAAWSALYGAAAAVLPNALLARGMTRGTSSNPGSAVFGFMFWEMVKIAVAVAMLVAAPRVVVDLSWPALLVTMIVCVKANWVALLWRRRPVATTKRV